MAKALLGHLGGPDPHLVAEISRLRRRVQDLEREVARLHERDDALAAARVELERTLVGDPVGV